MELLYTAIVDNNIRVVEFMLKHNIHQNITYNKESPSLLFWTNNYQMLCLLTEYIDVNIKNKYNRTCLNCKMSPISVSLLLDRGLEPTLHDKIHMKNNSTSCIHNLISSKNREKLNNKSITLIDEHFF